MPENAGSVESLLHLVLRPIENYRVRPGWFHTKARAWLSTVKGCSALLRTYSGLLGPIASREVLEILTKNLVPRSLSVYRDEYLSRVLADPPHLLIICVRLHPESRADFVEIASKAC